MKVGTQSSKMAPGLGNLGGTLVLAYVANDNSNDLKVTTSGDGGSTWTSSSPVTGQTSQAVPALMCITPEVIT